MKFPRPFYLGPWSAQAQAQEEKHWSGQEIWKSIGQ
jgi:hypothetical protein